MADAEKEDEEEDEAQDAEPAADAGADAEAQAAKKARRRPRSRRRRRRRRPRSRSAPKAPKEAKEPKAAGDDSAGATGTNRAARKVSGYQRKARECGFVRAGRLASAGFDAPSAMLSVADARRCIKFVPQNVEAHAFDVDEYTLRQPRADESVLPRRRRARPRRASRR